MNSLFNREPVEIQQYGSDVMMWVIRQETGYTGLFYLLRWQRETMGVGIAVGQGGY